MYTREPVTRPPYSNRTRIVSNEEIDDMIGSTDSETKFVDKAGLNHAIDELKKYIEDSKSGDVDLSDYVTQEQL